MSEPTFDFDFRPDYWDPADPITAITRNVKGELRRELIADIVSGRAAERAPDEATREMLSEVQSDLLPDELDDPNLLGDLHPWFMGGEYLPDYLPGEVEIARLVLRSTTMDVVSVRARPDGDLIRYRVVDEYPEIGPFAVLKDRRTSTRPLTFGEMIELIDAIAPNPAAWGDLYRLDCESYVECLREKSALPPYTLNDLKRAARFVTVRSPLYPQLEAFFEERARRWLDRKKEELAGEGKTKRIADGDARSSNEKTEEHGQMSGCDDSDDSKKTTSQLELFEESAAGADRSSEERS